MFTIIIPTWNNLDFLRLCVRSIKENSSFDHQIIVHVNDGSDGSFDWVYKKHLEHTYTPQNVGVCYAVNEAAMLARHDYILHLNDDMYCCPGWDSALVDKLTPLKTDLFMLSGTMIEPVETGNPCVIVRDYGKDVNRFAEKQLLADLPSLNKPDWLGATVPPMLVHRKWWTRVGGYSIEFSPGVSSNNDFSMKLWQAGCRIFLGVGNSLVYHFPVKSTGRPKKNNGAMQFLHKWGLRQSMFDRHYLRHGRPADGTIILPEPEGTTQSR